VSTSRIEFSKMLDVPRLLLKFSILFFQDDTAWSEDVLHPVRSFPLSGELVAWGVLFPPQNKVSHVDVTPHLWLKAEHLCYVLFPGSMIAPQNKI
jgi:hypothetical protein